MKITKIIDLPDKIGEQVRFIGRVIKIRKHGKKLIFMDVKDETATIQVICTKEQYYKSIERFIKTKKELGLK